MVQARPRFFELLPRLYRRTLAHWHVGNIAAFRHLVLIEPFLADTLFVDLAKYSETPISKVKSLLHYWFDKAFHHRPTVVVFDNMDNAALEALYMPWKGIDMPAPTEVWFTIVP